MRGRNVCAGIFAGCRLLNTTVGAEAVVVVVVAGGGERPRDASSGEYESESASTT